MERPLAESGAAQESNVDAQEHGTRDETNTVIATTNEDLNLEDEKSIASGGSDESRATADIGSDVPVIAATNEEQNVVNDSLNKMSTASGESDQPGAATVKGSDVPVIAAFDEMSTASGGSDEPIATADIDSDVPVIASTNEEQNVVKDTLNEMSIASGGSDQPETATHIGAGVQVIVATNAEQNLVHDAFKEMSIASEESDQPGTATDIGAPVIAATNAEQNLSHDALKDRSIAIAAVEQPGTATDKAKGSAFQSDSTEDKAQAEPDGLPRADMKADLTPICAKMETKMDLAAAQLDEPVAAADQATGKHIKLHLVPGLMDIEGNELTNQGGKEAGAQSSYINVTDNNNRSIKDSACRQMKVASCRNRQRSYTVVSKVRWLQYRSANKKLKRKNRKKKKVPTATLR